VRKEFSDIQKESRFDPLFDSRDEGKEKRIRANPADIEIETDKLLGGSYDWTHKNLCEEAKERLRNLRSNGTL
jgi:hypothetical protein